MEEAESLCDRVCILKDGKVLATDTPVQINHQIGFDYLLTLYNPSKEYFSTKEFSESIPSIHSLVHSSLGGGGTSYQLLPTWNEETRISYLIKESGAAVQDLTSTLKEQYPTFIVSLTNINLETAMIKLFIGESQEYAPDVLITEA